MAKKTSRLGSTFERLTHEGQGKKAFIPYIMAGDPSLAHTVDLVRMLHEQGADIVELGVPFSDPLADGPTIQQAAERALRRGVTLVKVLECVRSIRSVTDIPVVLMTYFNPVYKYGLEAFIDDALLAGVDGAIIPDLPPDTERSFVSEAARKGLDLIFLLAPTSTTERIKKVAAASQGYIYYVSITGITGSDVTIDEQMGRNIDAIRRISGKPVAVGFGIKTPEQARAAAAIADGVIVGSSIVAMVHGEDSGLAPYLASLRKAI